MPRLGLPGGTPLARTTAGVVGAIVVVSLLAMVLPDVGLWLATPAGRGHGVGMLAQLWRPLTAGVLTTGFLSIVLTAIFTYWCGSSLEAQLSQRRYLLVLAASVLAAAVVAAWLLPAYGLMGTAFSLAWGMIGAQTLIAYARGGQVQQQLLILGLLLLMSISMGGMSWLVSVGALAGGAGAAAIMQYLPGAKRRPDDWSRRRPTQSKRVDAALVGLCAVLLVLWLLAQLVG